MKRYNILLGKFGETLAKEFLRKKNHKIIRKNYKTQFGEIDIISEIENYLIFTEVKTRTNLKYGFASEAVNTSKQIKIVKSSLIFMSDANYHQINRSLRFDVIEVYVNLKNSKFVFEKIHHIENAINVEKIIDICNL